MDRCAPNFSDSTVSCFTKDALFKIIKAYNSKNADQIRVSKNDSKLDLWEAINLKMRETCGDDETCWLEQPFLRSHPDLDQFFKPLAPLGQYQWLSTDDIHNVMKQWEQKIPSFKFVGPLPMDFLKLYDPDSKYLQQLNLHNLNGIDRLGIIFNIDPSTKGGSHWVAMSINLKDKEINYFDSYGDKHYFKNKYAFSYQDSYGNLHRPEAKIAMPTAVQDLVYKMTNSQTLQRNKSTNSLPGGYHIKINTIQHQFANSECGVYSMLFVIKSINNTFERITQDIVMDEKANQYRDILFRRR